MSLAGLLTTLHDDTQLRGAIARAEAGPVPEDGPPGADLVAPPTLRPILVAALARRPGEDAGPGTPPHGGSGGHGGADSPPVRGVTGGSPPGGNRVPPGQHRRDILA